MKELIELKLSMTPIEVQALHRALYRDNPTGDLMRPNERLFRVVNKLRMQHGLAVRLEKLLRGCK